MLPPAQLCNDCRRNVTSLGWEVKEESRRNVVVCSQADFFYSDLVLILFDVHYDSDFGVHASRMSVDSFDPAFLPFRSCSFAPLLAVLLCFSASPARPHLSYASASVVITL